MMLALDTDHSTAASVSVRPVSYHEAAHAVVARAVDVGIAYAEVESRPSYSGVTQLTMTWSELRLEQFCVLSLAGRLAETRAFPLLAARGSLPESDATDRADVQLAIALERAGDGPGGRFVWWDVNSFDVAAEIWRYRQRARRLVDEHWRWITSVAHELEHRGRLTGSEIEALR
jgi:hypothetical protein